MNFHAVETEKNKNENAHLPKKGSAETCKNVSNWNQKMMLPLSECVRVFSDRPSRAHYMKTVSISHVNNLKPNELCRMSPEFRTCRCAVGSPDQTPGVYANFVPPTDNDGTFDRRVAPETPHGLIWLNVKLLFEQMVTTTRMLSTWTTFWRRKKTVSVITRV